MSPKEAYNELRKLWKNEKPLMSVLFGNENHLNSFTMFFINTVFVPPSRFRPESKVGEEKYLHDHTSILARITDINLTLKSIISKEFLAKDRELDGSKFTTPKSIELTKTLDLKKTQFYG